MGAMRRRRPGTLLLLSLACLGGLAVPFLPMRTDDTYIYFRYAEHLAEGKGFCFNPGEPSYGFTSPLWLFMLAGLARADVPLPAGSKALGMLFAFLTVVAGADLARRVLRTDLARAACVIALGGGAWFARWALSGLETPLAACLSLAALAARAWERERMRPPLASGILCALACLARPEGWLLCAILAIDTLVLPGRARRGLLHGGLFVTAMAVLAVPWSLFAQAHFGTWLPATFAAKGGQLATPEMAMRTVRTMLEIVLLTHAPAVAVIVATLLIRRGAGRGGHWLRGNWPWIAFLLALPAVYTLRGVVVLSRYLVPVMPLLVIAAFAGAERLAASARSLHTGLAIALFAANASAVALVMAPSTRSFDAAFETSLVTMGRWLRDNAAPDAEIAAADVGALGYYSDRPIIDLFGIVSRRGDASRGPYDPSALLASGAFLAMGNPAFVVERSIGPGDLASAPPLAERLELILSRPAGRLTLRRPDIYWYSLYRILPVGGEP